MGKEQPHCTAERVPNFYFPESKRQVLLGHLTAILFETKNLDIRDIEEVDPMLMDDLLNLKDEIEKVQAGEIEFQETDNELKFLRDRVTAVRKEVATTDLTSLRERVVKQIGKKRYAELETGALLQEWLTTEPKLWKGGVTDYFHFASRLWTNLKDAIPKNPVSHEVSFRPNVSKIPPRTGKTARDRASGAHAKTIKNRQERASDQRTGGKKKGKKA